MLQFNALLVACSPWSGLLQENAKRALSFCAALLCAWHVLLARCARSDANAWRIASVGLLAAHHTSALPRSADLLPIGSRNYPNLV